MELLGDDLTLRSLVVGGLLGSGLLYLVYSAQRALQRLGLRRRMRRARRGEERAERLLERAGYQIEGRQVAATLRYQLDGRSLDVTVVADVLARRGGRRYVAEVKTGRAAPKLTTSSTRRQLLEYAHAFDVQGILLIDMERDEIHTVEVPRRAPAGWLARWLS